MKINQNDVAFEDDDEESHSISDTSSGHDQSNNQPAEAYPDEDRKSVITDGTGYRSKKNTESSKQHPFKSSLRQSSVHSQTGQSQTR